MAKSDDDWQKEADADTLINAEMIRQDSKRYKAAVKYIEAKNKATKAAMKSR